MLEKNEKLLKEANLFTQENIQIVNRLEKQFAISQSNESEEDEADQDIRGKANSSVHNIANILEILQKANLLNQDIFNKLMTTKAIQYPEHLEEGLAALHKAGLMTEENLSAYFARAHSINRNQQKKQSGSGLSAAINFHSAIEALEYKNILVQENFEAILKSVPYSLDMQCALINFSEANILNQETRNVLTANPANVYSLGEIVIHLKKANLLNSDNLSHIITNALFSKNLDLAIHDLNYRKLLTQENLMQLIDHISQINEISKLLRAMLDSYPYENDDLLTQQNFNIIMGHAQHAKFLTSALNILEDSNIHTQENFLMLINNLAHADILNAALEELKPVPYSVKKNLLNQDSFTLLIENFPHSLELAKGIKLLKNSNLLDKENLKELIRAEKNALVLAQGLVILNNNDLLDETNRVMLLNNPQHADRIANGIQILFEENLLNDVNLPRLLTSPEFADDIAKAICDLNFENLMNDENLSLVLATPQYITGIVITLYELNETNLLTPENHTLLSNNVENAAGIGKCLSVLRQMDLHSQENFSAIVDNAQHAQTLFKILKFGDGRLVNQDDFNTLMDLARFSEEIYEDLISSSAPYNENFAEAIMNAKKREIAPVEKAARVLAQTNFPPDIAVSIAGFFAPKNKSEIFEVEAEKYFGVNKKISGFFSTDEVMMAQNSYINLIKDTIKQYQSSQASPYYSSSIRNLLSLLNKNLSDPTTFNNFKAAVEETAKKDDGFGKILRENLGENSASEQTGYKGVRRQ